MVANQTIQLRSVKKLHFHKVSCFEDYMRSTRTSISSLTVERDRSFESTPDAKKPKTMTQMVVDNNLGNHNITVQGLYQNRGQNMIKTDS